MDDFVPGLQAATAPHSGQFETKQLVRALWNALDRVAMVEIDGRPKGTGILVGGDLLLTAAHVMGAGVPPPVDGTIAVFDLHATAETSPAETGTRIRVAEYLDGTPLEAAELDRACETGGPPDWLDFALLRLARPVPDIRPEQGPARPRGHYRLDPANYAFDKAGLLMIVQHPLGSTQKTSVVVGPARPDPQGTRLRYRANTQVGSSGAAVIDERGRLVAIHHFFTGTLNQGVPVSAIVRALIRGRHAATVRRAAALAAPIQLSWAALDEDRARWVRAELTAAGYDVFPELPRGQARAQKLRRRVDEGARVFALVSRAYLEDEDGIADWNYTFYLDPASASHRLVPMLIDGEPDGLFALLPPIDLRGRDPVEARRRLLEVAAGPPDTTRANCASASSPLAVGFRPTDPLPRLRRLSDRAHRAAGTVPGTNFADAEQNQFAAGLYVTRDLEDELDWELRIAPATPLVVVGEPGSGKTSMLWGMARRLCGAPEGEVFFVKATWLASDEPGGGTRVDAELLTEAITAARGTGRTVALLIDTVDVLVNNDESWETLVTVVETAVDAGASVVMTSRVAEAGELPITWKRCELSDYATDGPGKVLSMDGEFARAVIVHSRFFTQDPRRREDLVSRMLGIVARDLSLKSLCLRPLTLRMLFEIYTPGQVSDVVDTTGLYEAYWNNRVVQDRRVWDMTADRGDGDRNLSETAQLLALEMLRTGLPEAVVRSMALPASMPSHRLEEEIDLLVRRGVGQRSENGVFQFFHQTFFEYAASRALVFGHSGAGIDALVAQVEKQPDDYYLLAVLEQALLCAGRARETALHATGVLSRLLLRFAKELEDRKGRTAYYGLRQVVLAVCAQSPLLDEDMIEALTSILGSARFELPALRDFLQLLPAPARRFGAHDERFLKVAAGRADNAWLAVIDVLARLLPRDSAAAINALRQIGLVDRAVEGDYELTHRGELRDFLVSLVLWEPDEALPILRSLVTSALANGKADYVALLFARMAELGAAHPDAGDWAAWANLLLGDATAYSSQLIKDYAAVITPRLRKLGYAELVEEFREVTDRLISTDVPATVDRSLFGAILTVIGDRCPPDTDPGPFLESLTQAICPKLVADLSRGWLVPLLDSDSPVGAATRDLAVEWLSAGMPSSRVQDGNDDIRVKVIHTAIMRLDLPPHRAADVAGRAAAEWTRQRGSDTDPVTAWTGPGGLMHLVVRGAAAGIPEAAAAIDRLRDVGSLESAHARALVEPFGVHAGSEQETVLLLDLLLWTGEAQRALLPLRHGNEMDDATLGQLQASALAEFRAATPAERPNRLRQQERDRLRSLAKLLVRLDALGGGLTLEWSELTNWLDRALDVEVTGHLVDLVGSGLERGEYPPEKVFPLLRALCRADAADPPDCSSAQARAARRWCVWGYANHGEPEDVPELFRLAFAPPHDHHTLIRAISYVYKGRNRTPLTTAQSVDFLLKMGRRIRTSGLGSARRKDVANAWKAAMWHTVPGSGTSLQLRIVKALPELDDFFAGNLVQYISPGRRPDVLNALQTVAAAEAIGPRLGRNVNDVLDRHRRHSSDGGWPDLFQEVSREQQ